VVQLGKLNLQFALESAGSQRKYIEDKAGSIDDPTRQCAFEIAFLRRRKRVVDEHQLGLDLVGQCPNLVELALPDQKPRIDSAQPRVDVTDEVSARGAGKGPKFFGLLPVRWRTYTDMQKKGAFAALGPIKQSAAPNQLNRHPRRRRPECGHSV
jgi:hypothetical protein